MSTVNPMFHMDSSFDWRWYITDVSGKDVCMSSRSFFHYEDARRDFDNAKAQLIASCD